MTITTTYTTTDTDMALINEAARIAGLYKIAIPGGAVSAYLLRRYEAITAQLGYDPIS